MLYLTIATLEELAKYGTHIHSCRGREYTNGDNLLGINSGVEAYILNIDHQAFFIRCGCHRWNRLLVEAAYSSAVSKIFCFILINQINQRQLRTFFNWIKDY